ETFLFKQSEGLPSRLWWLSARAFATAPVVRGSLPREESQEAVARKRSSWFLWAFFALRYDASALPFAVQFAFSCCSLASGRPLSSVSPLVDTDLPVITRDKI